MKLRDYLFSGFKPCLDSGCVIKKPTGMQTNGGCKCVLEFSRTQLQILSGRINNIGDQQINLFEELT